MPIRRFAEASDAFLRFPSSHSMSRWRSYSTQSRIPTLGRLGDTVDFPDLPESVQTVAMANEVGALVELGDSSTESCGSPGEVANQPEYDHRFTSYLESNDKGNEALFRAYSMVNGKSMVCDPVDRQIRPEQGCENVFCW